MVINNNPAANSAYNIVNNTSNQLTKAISKLSSGLRINSAADDAAGLAISEKMRAQIGGLDQASSNAQDGISLIQTAEGALGETHSILQRMRELSVQAANDTLTQQDRSYIQTEVDELREEITRIGNTTQFNKKKLLNGDAAALWSSNDLETKAVINGGLREIDQFGQKKSVEGNYKIKITADPGKAEVQKTDIMKIKHPNVMTNKVVDTATGVDDVSINNMPAGSYTVAITGEAPEEAAANVTGVYGVDTSFSKSTLIGGSARGDDLLTALTADDVDGYENKMIRITDGSNVLAEYEVQVGDTAQGIQQNLMNQLNGEKAQAIAGEAGYKLEAYWNTDENNDGDPDGIFTVAAYRTDGVDVKTLTIEGGAVDALQADQGDTTEAEAHSSLTGDDGPLVINVNEENLDGNASVLFEVTDVNTTAGTITLKATANITTTNGINKTTSQKDIVLNSTGTTEITGLIGKNAETADQEDGTGAFNMQLSDSMGADAAKLFSKGDKFVVNFVSTTASSSEDGEVDQTITIDGQLNPNWDDAWSGSATRTPLQYGIETSEVAGKDVHFKNFYLDERNGEAIEGDVTVSFNDYNFDKDRNDLLGEARNVATFDATYIGQVATGDTKLRDIDKMWDAQGNFLLDDPKTITIVQGDGKTADVTLYASDTLDEVAAKLNDAIANDLGQGKYVDDARHFVEFVGSTADQKLTGSSNDSVSGTFVIRSAVPGAAGTITLSGNSEELLNAFSLNTLQDATESKYDVSVYDAHTNDAIATNVKITGNKLIGVVNDNVDVIFDAMSGVRANWDDVKKSYTYADSEETETTLHLSDNTTVLQVGANEGEDMALHIGDMRATALGLDSVNVMDRDMAARSITIIDNAIDKVSTQRAKIGAYQNRLEYTVSNLTTASENLTAAESRIRDADMAKEMMNFTKLNIMLQAGNSMLSQANQQPQQVLSLIR